MKIENFKTPFRPMIFLRNFSDRLKFRGGKCPRPATTPLLTLRGAACCVEQRYNDVQVQRHHFPAKESLRAVSADSKRLLSFSTRSSGKSARLQYYFASPMV